MSVRPYIEAGNAAQAAAEQQPVPACGQRWTHRTEQRTVTINRVWDGVGTGTAVAVVWGDRGQCGTAMSLDVFHRAYEPEQPHAETAPDPWPTIARLVQWLDDANDRTDAEITLRLFKLSEEVGEVAQAWIGAMGQNPRKGFTHHVGHVADELCDVIVTAMVALTSITDTPGEIFAAKVQQIAALRLPNVDGES